MLQSCAFLFDSVVLLTTVYIIGRHLNFDSLCQLYQYSNDDCECPAWDNFLHNDFDVRSQSYHDPVSVLIFPSARQLITTELII